MRRSSKKRTEKNVFGSSSLGKGVASRPLEQVVHNYGHYYAFGDGHTAKAKRTDLRHFLSFMREFRGVSQLSRLKVADWDQSATQRFVDERLRQGEAPTTVARRLATLKHMGRTLAEKVPGFINPAREVRSPKFEVPRPKGLREEELTRIKKRARERVSNKRTFQRIRNETILHLLLDTGLRADEIRMLRREQLDDSLEWILSVRTKGRRYRNVYVSTSMRPRLRSYLEARAQELKRFFPKLTLSVDKDLPLFVSNYRASAAQPQSFFMGAKTLWRAVNECSAGTSLHPHLLRHAFALELLEHTGDVRLVSQALGHGDTKVTMRYTERHGEEIARALEKIRGAKRNSKGR